MDPRDLLAHITPDQNVSLESEIFPVLAKAGSISVFPCAPPLLDMLDPVFRAIMTWPDEFSDPCSTKIPPPSALRHSRLPPAY